MQNNLLSGQGEARTLEDRYEEYEPVDNLLQVSDDPCMAGRQLLEDLCFDNISLVGHGMFGNVFIANTSINTLRTLNQVLKVSRGVLQVISRQPNGVAVKCISNIVEPWSLDSFWKELEQLKCLAHPNIMRAFVAFQVTARSEVFEAGCRFRPIFDQIIDLLDVEERLSSVIIMERLGADLRSLKRRFQMDSFNEKEVLHLFRDLGNALVYLHDKGITHDDIHDGNAVTSGLDHQLTQREQFTCFPVKLIDFGLAVRHDITEQNLGEIDCQANIANWPGEEYFLRENLANNRPKSRNPFRDETVNFANMLMAASLDSQELESRRDTSGLYAVFIEHSSVKSASLRKALLMMACKDDHFRITLREALNLVDA